ncbi:MAG: hypothetical protein AAF552_08190, partial [Pseudomonadota bacterium]
MKATQRTLLSIAIATSLAANAQDGMDELDETVIGAEEAVAVDDHSLSTDDLVRQMTDTIEDTVRYIPG